MNIYCKALDKSFTDKKELFKELKANKDQIIDAKKAEILKSCDKGIAIDLHKIKFTDQNKNINIDDDYYYIAVNSTLILDSHEDLHLNKIWNRSVKNQQGKNYLVWDHTLGGKSTIVRKEHIEMFTATVPFASIGKSYPGDTEILVYKFRKDKVIDKDAKEWLESGDEIQASVRMQYVDIVLALNSESPDDIKEKKNFDEYYPLIANKEDFENEILYFWAVKEAKNVMESSLVLFGSNHVTGQIEESKKVGSAKATQQNNDSALATQKEQQENNYREFLLNS